MRIRVRLFASFREQIGSPEIWLDLEEGTSIRALTSALHKRYPDMDNGLIAINGRYSELEMIVEENDEVAFFPPVSGG